jgi:hypothetical protein
MVFFLQGALPAVGDECRLRSGAQAEYKSVKMVKGCCNISCAWRGELLVEL